MEFEKKFGTTEEELKKRLRNMTEQEVSAAYQTIVFLEINDDAEKKRLEIMEEIHAEKVKESHSSV